jgi:hypothetical protein
VIVCVCLCVCGGGGGGGGKQPPFDMRAAGPDVVSGRTKLTIQGSRFDVLSCSMLAARVAVSVRAVHTIGW